MTCWQAMAALEALGYRFTRTAEGRVLATLQGNKPPEASALLEIVRRDREAAAAYVREREAGAVVADDGSTVSLLDALAIAQAVHKGEARLIGKVVFHRLTGDVTVHWEPLQGAAEELLTRRRERLKAALKAQIKAMDEADYWNLTAEEYEAICARYGRYCRILEGFK